MEVGADDFVVKPISTKVLLARIKRLLRRHQTIADSERLVAPEILSVKGIIMNRQNYTINIDSDQIFFPKKEFELLVKLAANSMLIYAFDFRQKKRDYQID